MIDPHFPFLRGEDLWFESAREQTFKERRKETVCVANLIDHLLLFGDLADELFSQHVSIRDQVKILSMTQDLVIQEWNGYLMSLVYGAYENCARSLRWILETVILSGGAVFDAKLLSGEYPAGPAQLSTYETWLRDYDKRGRFGKKEALLRVGFSQNEISAISDAYSGLCKFCHTSTRTVMVRRKKGDFDWLYRFDPNEFDEILSMSYVVIDTTLSIALRSYRSLARSVSNAEEQSFVEFIESYRYHTFGFNEPPSTRERLEWNRLPMTSEFLLANRKESNMPSPLDYEAE